jgi:cyclophilin family peptidyl-prolyl cis-trans isomerase
MPNRSRERQLAKLAARRQAEAQRRRHRRNLILSLVAVVAGLALVVSGLVWWLGGSNGTTAATSASPTPSPSPSASASIGPSPCGNPTPPADASQKKPSYKTAPPMTIDVNATYTATFETTCGSFTAKLLPKVAPQGVNSFVYLANQHFYDGLTFHRIVKGFVIQGGDPLGNGKGGPGYNFDIETSPKATFDAPGVLAYANSGPGTNGSQFFVTLASAPQLNPTASASYTIFGNVTKGMDVVQKIGSVPTVTGPACAGATEACSPSDPIFILKVTINEQK